MALISSTGRQPLSRVRRSPMAAAGVYRRPLAGGGTAVGFTDPTVATYPGGAVTIPADQDAVLYPAGTDPSLDLDNHGYALFVQPGNPVLWACRQEDYAAVATAIDIVPRIYSMGPDDLWLPPRHVTPPGPPPFHGNYIVTSALTPWPTLACSGLWRNFTGVNGSNPNVDLFGVPPDWKLPGFTGGTLTDTASHTTLFPFGSAVPSVLQTLHGFPRIGGVADLLWDHNPPVGVGYTTWGMECFFRQVFTLPAGTITAVTMEAVGDGIIDLVVINGTSLGIPFPDYWAANPDGSGRTGSFVLWELSMTIPSEIVSITPSHFTPGADNILALVAIRQVGPSLYPDPGGAMSWRLTFTYP